VTERKQAEAEREQLLIREQTAREQAEKANRIKDEFLAVLSHELRTPLNPILGWAKLLQAGRLDTVKMQQAFSTIERNARLQIQLIDDLLDVSRILRGKLTPNCESVNPISVIEAAIDTVRLATEAKSIHLQTALALTVGSVLDDAGRLQQVVWNLLTNAVKFTPHHGRIEVRLTQAETNAQIQVIDTGKGIHPDFLPHVFERFQQADSSTTRQFGGLGLGLAIVRQLVELHGGTVAANSKGEGQGAVFTVCLPLSQPATAVAAASDNVPQSTSLSGLCILVVDDEADARELVQFILEQEGAIVTAVGSAIEAIQVLRQSEVQVLISDIGMADIDGYMLLERLRSEGILARKPIPAIALTAYAGELNQQKARAAGFADHLSKPLDPEALITTIANVIFKTEV
jgi:CheY-like chemotaxis protein